MAHTLGRQKVPRCQDLAHLGRGCSKGGAKTFAEVAVARKPQIGSQPSKVVLSLLEPVEGQREPQAEEIAGDSLVGGRPELTGEVGGRGVDGVGDPRDPKN